jgi:HAD superfamily hydrolase (TIGR01509 family)
MNPTPVIFDCDGVLVDTHGHWDRAYTALFTRYGARLHRDDRRRLVGLSLGRLGDALADLLGHPAPAGVLAQQIREFLATNTGTGISPMPGAPELVTALAGTRPLAITSNNPAEIVHDYLQATGIPHVFDTIVGADDTHRPKPAPDLYHHTCQQLGVPCASVIVLEDSPLGVQSALTAGTTVFAIPDLPQTRPLAHRSFPSLTDPTLWEALDLVLKRQCTDRPVPRPTIL